MSRVTENDLTSKPKVRSRKFKGPWFRGYREDVTNSKLQRLPIALRWRWYELCCLASGDNGVLPDSSQIAFSLRVDDHEAECIVCELIKAGFVEQTWAKGAAPILRMAQWEQRQFVCDMSAERMRRLRDKRKGNRQAKLLRDGTCDVTSDADAVVLSSTVSRSETESYDHPRNEAAGAAVRQDRGASVAVRLRQGIGGKNDGGNFDKGGN